jgi:hypothetical protein
MLKRNPAAPTAAILSLLAATLAPLPAFAAPDHRDLEHGETRRGAFAGTSFRVELGPRARAPGARLQLGMRAVSGSGRSAAPVRTTHMPALEIGIGGRDAGEMFIAGRSRAEVERSLGLGPRGARGTTVTVIGAVALIAVGILVLTNLDGLSSEDE